MKFISSPAKLMNINNSTTLLKATTPHFIKEATTIQSYLKQKSPKELSQLMEISSKLADENWQRNQNWNPKPKKIESCSAMYAFTGEVYRGLEAATLDKEAADYLQKNFRILSGLYGLLKPSDQIMLYRLEMGRPFGFENHKNLYQFWSDKITSQLNSEMKNGEPLLNLASTEYAKVINKKELKGNLIDFSFYEIKEGKPKTIVVYTKHARGLVIRFCAETKAKTLNDVKAFNYDGYRLNEKKTNLTHLVFER